MVDSGITFTINPSNVVHEEIDGETIMVNLAGGCYYSLAGGGPLVWSRLDAGASADEIVATVAAEEDDLAEVREQVLDLLERLAAEALVVPAPDPDGRPAGSTPPEAPSTRFEKPVFEKYDDLKDYFLIDPIHEVGATGWPHTPDA